MNTSELTSRQTELARQLNDTAFIQSLPQEQQNLLRREKETLDAFLATESQVNGANIPTGQQDAREGVAYQPHIPDVDPGNQQAGAALRAQQRLAEAPLAAQGQNGATAAPQAG